MVNREFGISQPAVSQHREVLREAGFASVRADGQRRLDQSRAFWQHEFDALETEIARGQRARRTAQSAATKATSTKSAAKKPAAARRTR